MPALSNAHAILLLQINVERKSQRISLPVSFALGGSMGRLDAASGDLPDMPGSRKMLKPHPGIPSPAHEIFQLGEKTLVIIGAMRGRGSFLRVGLDCPSVVQGVGNPELRNDRRFR